MKIANRISSLILTLAASTALAHSDPPTVFGPPLNDDQRTELIQAINQDVIVHAALQNEISYGEKCSFTLNKATDQGGENGWYFESQFLCKQADGGLMFILDFSGVYLSKLIIDGSYDVDRNHP